MSTCCRSGRQLRRHARAQPIRCRIVRCRSDEPAQLEAFGDTMLAARAALDVAANDCFRVTIELPIDVRVEISFDELTHHGTVSIDGVGLRTATRRSRARANRDMTVPIGTRSTVAISLY